jgi:hypothetical protein
MKAKAIIRPPHQVGVHFSGEARHAGIQRISITGDAGFLILSVPEAPVSHRQPTFGTPEKRA